MRPLRSRYVTACQQLLALGVVVVALAPATRVVSLDVVSVQPDHQSRLGAAPHSAARLGGSGGSGGAVEMAAYSAAATRSWRVASQVVDPTVREIPLTGGASTGSARTGGTRSLAGVQSRFVERSTGRTRITSRPQAVTGYGTVGVTWAHGESVPESDIALQVRTRTGGTWSDWQAMDYHAEHGPDPGSAEAEHARPGTDESLVGHVDQVQVRVTAAAGETPDDMELAVIDPGRTATTYQRPAIDTSRYDDELPASMRRASSNATTAVTPKPQIFSRAQWGADERMRDKSSLRYYEVHGGFVHHTVNANNYTADEVPAILRSIYAYHVRSRGWSDIGYNFLVDRFGRIWEGRYGGVDRPVVGAHTLGYNDYSFAMSAIGNYDITQPSDAMIQAYGVLFAWKLSLHGVSAGAGATRIGPTTFGWAINGHRDAASTACPGRYLYAKLPQIRALAAAAQASWAGRDLQSNLVGGPYPDVLLRKASNHKLFILPLNGPGNPPGRKVRTGIDLTDANAVLKVGDWDRDGFGDVVVRQASTGNLLLYRGDGTGHFAAPTVIGGGFNAVTLLAAVGDFTGDGYPDLMGQMGNAVYLWPGASVYGTLAPYVAASAIPGATALYGAGLWDGDGAPDALVRIGSTMKLYPGNGPGGLTAPVPLALNPSVLDWIVPVADDDGAGHTDLVGRNAYTGDLYLFPASAGGFGAPVYLAHASKFDMVG